MERRGRVAILVSLAVAALLALAAGSLRRGYEAALVLADIAAGDGASQLKLRVAAPKRSEVRYRAAGRLAKGDLYRPATGCKAALLLLPGVAEAGKDDPRLVAFATTLARAGFAVLVPDLPGLRQLQVGPNDIGEVVAAFAWLTSEGRLAPRGRAGMAAFSYAAGPALLAALDESIASRVQFLFAVGGYYDLPQVLTFCTTGYYRRDDRWHYLPPNDYGKWAFVAGNIQRLGEAGDRAIFRLLTQRMLADPLAPATDLIDGLGAEGRALYDFVVNRDPLQSPRLLAALPAALRRDLDTLNPAARDLSRLSARLILVHGLDDRMIPYVESASLARAVPKGRARLFLVQGLAHVDVAPELPDRWRLWRAVKALLAARDGTL